MKRTILASSLMMLVLGSAGSAIAENWRSNVEANQEASASQELPLAIGGFDPTLYFAGGLPKAGDPSISYAFEGQVYYFATYQSRQSFIEDPTKYAPQYAGHCAFAMSEHQTVSADPSVFTVLDEKLYLFQDREKLEMWKTNSRKLRLLADKRWEIEAKNFTRFEAKF